MSFQSLLLHTVTIFNPDTGTPSRYNDPDDQSFDDGYETDARVQQLISDEDLRDRDTRVTQYRVFLMPEETVSSLSQVEWNGVMHRVVGEPAEVADRSSTHHLELLMERING